MLFDYNFKWRSDSVRGVFGHGGWQLANWTKLGLASQALDMIEGLAVRQNMLVLV